MLSFILIDKAKYELAITITKYFFVSVLSFGLNVVINVICYELFNFSPVIVYPFSVLSISAMNFLLCRYFIFKNSTSKKLFTQGYQFILSTVLFRLAEYVFFSATFQNFGYMVCGWHYFHTIFMGNYEILFLQSLCISLSVCLEAVSK